MSDGQQNRWCIYNTVSLYAPYLSEKMEPVGAVWNSQQPFGRSTTHTRASHNALITIPILSLCNPDRLDASHSTQAEKKLSKQWISFSGAPLLHCLNTTLLLNPNLTPCSPGDPAPPLTLTPNTVLKWHLSCCIILGNLTAQRQTTTPGVRLRQKTTSLDEEMQLE